MVEHGHLSAHQIWKTVSGRAREAGFENIAPHDMRRFVISTLLETTDPVMVAQIVGHKRPTTTAKYDRRPARRQRQAVATISMPRLANLRPDLIR
ncbi:tyrosine-type recombinase/integrase [Nocardioides caldifontis]|uniref:tyrosine-type recombinase/integrase n=1 Tax=Nocardioides caldifontis TaxID=2588938 RepID=UPI0011DF4155|nr:tyrosine-type recombinase/integrase [Nocardioides caldifontis]